MKKSVKTAVTETKMDFLSFLKASPTQYHFARLARDLLIENGFTEFNFTSDTPARGFFVREGRSVVAWNMKGTGSAVVFGCHCDSPGIKPMPDSKRCSIYGGPLIHTWLDRDLKLAGCIDSPYGPKLYESNGAVGICPSLAVHYKPLKEGLDKEENFNPMCEGELPDGDLFFVDAEEPRQIGDFVAAQRLDNLTSCYAGLMAFISTKDSNNDQLNIYIAFDNEEIGSNTWCGARSNIINDVISMLVPRTLAHALKCNSLVLSADTLHGYNPLYDDKYAEDHHITVGSGIGLERDASGSVCYGMVAEYAVRSAAKKLGYNIQTTTEKNCEYGGTTIGPTTETVTGIRTVDIGIGVIGMHSIREHCSAKDVSELRDIVAELYSNYSKHKPSN